MNLGDQEFAHWLPVAVLAPVMLLGPHLEDNDLGGLEVFNDLCLYSDIVQVWPSYHKVALILHGKHARKANSSAWLCLRNSKTLHQPSPCK